jgi:hypothetical protein
MAPVHSKHTSCSTQSASSPSRYNKVAPTNVRATILIDHVRHIIDYYVEEYYELGRPAGTNATEDPNNNKPSTI